MQPERIWTEQCEAARGIEDEFGTQKALDYLFSAGHPADEFHVYHWEGNYFEVEAVSAEWRGFGTLRQRSSLCLRGTADTMSGNRCQLGLSPLHACPSRRKVE